MKTLSNSGSRYEYIGLWKDFEELRKSNDSLSLGNGSTFLVMDRGVMYMYDKEQQIWHLL